MFLSISQVRKFTIYIEKYTFWEMCCFFSLKIGQKPTRPEMRNKESVSSGLSLALERAFFGPLLDFSNCAPIRHPIST